MAAPCRAIEVHRECDPTAPYAAILRLRGEHDYGTAPEIADSLSRLPSSVLVDVTECSFVDSSVVAVLLSTSRGIAEAGGQFTVTTIRDSIVDRAFEILGLPAVIDLQRVSPAHDASPGDADEDDA